jgi:exonuclease VII small subunit
VKQPTDTIDLLRSTLQTGIVSGAVESAAVTYARLCQECSVRLERISAMLEKGSDYQALQAAEEEPPLLDLLAVLSFGGEKAWLDFCQAHQLPIAPKLDAKTVQALDRLYAQGVTANHPLYKDFRAAVLSREDEKALRIIRTIHKLNPGDDNARSELQRLENKQWQDMLEQLRAALKTDDEERISTLTEKIAIIVPIDKRNAVPEIMQAEGIRKALRRRQAEERLPAYLEDALKHRDAGDWKSAAESCEIIQELIEIHDLELSGSQKATLEEASSYARRERAASERQNAFSRSLGQFTTFAQEAGTRLMTGTPPKLQEAGILDETFIRHWRELESYQLHVADDVLNRLRQTGQNIRTALERAQRARRLRTMLSAASLFAFLLGIGALAWHGWQARAYTLDLASYRARQLLEPAAKLTSSLKQDHGSLLRWPYLKSKIEETEAWVSQARSLSSQADQMLTQLEAAASKNFAGMKPVEILKHLDDARSQINQLPGDLATTAGLRMASLKTKAELTLANLGETRSSDARLRLESIHASLKSDLSYERPSASVTEVIAKLEAQIIEIESLTKAEASALQFPSDLQAQLKAARQRVDDFKQELTRFAELRESTLNVNSLSEYGSALTKWQDIRFAEAAPAASTATALPSEEQFLASLMTGGDLILWKAAVADVSGAKMHPDLPQDGDLKVLLSLRDDRHLNGVWENIITDHSAGRGKRSVWSQGPLSESRVGDTQRRWSGKAFDPHPQDTGAAFIDQEYKRLVIGGGSEQGQTVISSKPATVTVLIQNLQLDRMTDTNGERFERSLLSILDRLMADTASPGIAKAYVMLELERLTRERPFEWGLHLTPTLRTDLAELHRLIGDYPLRSEDWMIPKVRSSLGGVLDAFFKARHEQHYEKEAQARRVLITRIATTGVKYGGYVETDRQLRLNISARSAKEFWLLGKGTPLLISTATKAAPADALPLSPVLFLPVDRLQLMETYRTSISGSSLDKAESDTEESPFLKP